MTTDSVFRGVEVERAVFNHTSYSFPEFGVFSYTPHSFFARAGQGVANV
jgi:hypothetical protein